ncbi:hypothetical protein ACH5RR_027059 [Cinchona calisaya]|uniref:Uncharacterized protein n=1 Tax=Cinchona calisaya TaxID=153742 RepID=A0ABD2Z7K7_9GENT
MASPATAITPSSCPIMFFKSLPHQLHGAPVGHVCSRRISAYNPVKSSRMEQFNEPAKFKVHINDAMKKLYEFIPDSVQNFPWAKAESVAMQHLLAIGQEALKWSLTALFILSSVSDIIYSISRNKELVIPFGLFFGCAVADFLKETSQKYFHHSQERGKNWQLVGIGCFFVLVRIIAFSLSVEPQAFLLHAANGGLMLVLWQWKSSLQPEHDYRPNDLSEDAASTQTAEN